MFRYIGQGLPSALASVETLNTQFHAVAAAVTPETPTRAHALDDAVAGQASYYSAFQADRRYVTATSVRKFIVIGQLDERAAPVTQPLDTLAGLEAARSASSVAAARDSAGQALAVGLAGAILAVLAGFLFAVFVARMLSRAQRREADLTAALGRLSDRDELLARLRTASLILGETAAELRKAARNAAAVTSEQSAAVAQTSTTIQELAATAGSIADTVRSVSMATERAGDTMHDMQEKVEAIAERALYARRAGAEDRRDPRADQRDRRADEPARAERRDRGGPGRRGRQGVRRRGGRGAQAGRAVDALDRVDRRDHRRGPGRDERDDHGDRTGHPPGTRGRGADGLDRRPCSRSRSSPPSSRSPPRTRWTRRRSRSGRRPTSSRPNRPSGRPHPSGWNGSSTR